MVALGEAHSTEEQEDQGPSVAMWTLGVAVIGCVLWKLKTLRAAAVFLKRKLLLERRRRKGKEEEKRKKDSRAKEAK